MTFWKIVTFACAATILADAKWLKHSKRDIPSNICDPAHNNTNLVQCYCTKDTKHPQIVKNADCYLTVATILSDHDAWKAFKTLKNAHKITFTNSRGIPLVYVPTNSLVEAHSISQFEIKNGIIERIEPFAFANLSTVEKITLSVNSITSLAPHAFAHHKRLKAISLDSNSLTEINRNVFVDLPALDKLYFTNNAISTLHDKAFIHLGSLKELEIDRNKVFSLNFATFEGLKNLEKLDLSSNALEVIGDNTFEALVNLKSLNLADNKIQMLDEKAFNGLGKIASLSLAQNNLTEIKCDTFKALQNLESLNLADNKIQMLDEKAFNGLGKVTFLSLAHNNLTEIKRDTFKAIQNLESLNLADNKIQMLDENAFNGLAKIVSLSLARNNLTKIISDKLFEGLNSLQSFSLKENQIKELTSVAMAPILSNFYSSDSSFEFEDNNFACNCRLDWFNSLMNKTLNKNLKRSIENLKCVPDAPLRDAWTKLTEAEKTQPVTEEDEHLQVPDYEYYDETQLEGKLFYMDVRDLLICDQNNTQNVVTPIHAKETTNHPTTYKVTNAGLLSLADTTPVIEMNKRDRHVEDKDFTTTRLATVSAKPGENKIYEDMASDEGRPDKIKAHRSVQENPISSNANKSVGCVLLLMLMLLFRLDVLELSY